MVEMKTLTLAGVKYAIKDEYARDQIQILNIQNDKIESDIDSLEGRLQNLATNSVKSINGQIGHVILDAADVNAVPTYRTVNGKKLEKNIVLTAADVGALPANTVIPSIEGLATETYVNEKVADIVDSAPETLDTLNELAAALNNNENFANEVLEQIGTKVPSTRKINNKSLASDITLTATDVGALPANTAIPSIEGLATEKYVNDEVAKAKEHTDTAIANLVGSAPDKLDTLNELAAALNNNANFANEVLNQIGTKVPQTRTINGKPLTGDIILNAADVGAVTESYVNDAVSNIKIPTINYPVTSVNGKTGAVVLSAADVGALPSTTKIPSIEGLATEKYVDSAVAGLATETYVNNKVSGIVNSAPETLDTLNELASALGNDPNFATTISNQIGTKVPQTRKINGKTLTSDITLSAADVGATTENYVNNAIKNLTTKEYVDGQDAKLQNSIINLQNYTNNQNTEIQNRITNLQKHVESEDSQLKNSITSLQNKDTELQNDLNYLQNNVNHLNTIPAIEFVLYTDLKKQYEGYWGVGGTGRYASQLLRINESKTYYLAYNTIEGNIIGAYFDAAGQQIGVLKTGDVKSYVYHIADGNSFYKGRNPKITESTYNRDGNYNRFGDVVLLYSFDAPKNAYYISLNILPDNHEFSYCQYICSKPIFALSNSGNQIIYDGDPFYQEKKNRKLCIIGASGVSVDRVKSVRNKTNQKEPELYNYPQYTVGFQEYIMPWYERVDSYGFWSGSWARQHDLYFTDTTEYPENPPEPKRELSIYTGVTTSDIDFSIYDEFLFTPSTAELTVGGLGDITSTNLEEYFGGLNGVIKYLVKQRTDKGLSFPKFYIANTVHKGGYYNELQTKIHMDAVNSKLADFCTRNSYQLIDLVSGTTLNDRTYLDLTWDGTHLNQKGGKLQGECIVKAILGGSSVETPRIPEDQVDFSLYTKFDFIPGRWDSIANGTISYSGFHSQFLRVNPEITYYTGYVDTSKQFLGAFFNQEGQWIKTIEIGTLAGRKDAEREGDIKPYTYDLPDVYLKDNTNYLTMYSFKSPIGAYYFSFNLVEEEKTDYIYRRYISSKPLFSHTQAGNNMLYKHSSPLYEKKKTKKLCIIGDEDVCIDRMYNSTFKQYTIGFQEYLMRWYDEVKSLGYHHGYNKDTAQSIYNSIVTGKLDLTEYDDFLIMPSILELTSGNIGTVDDAAGTNTYFGCLTGIIKYIREQRVLDNKKYLPAQFYLANVLRRGAYYNGKQDLMEDLNTKIASYCGKSSNDCELINIRGGTGLVKANYQNYTSNGTLLNQAGNELLGNYLVKRIIKDDNAIRATIPPEDRISALETKIAELEAIIAELVNPSTE